MRADGRSRLDDFPSACVSQPHSSSKTRERVTLLPPASRQGELLNIPAFPLSRFGLRPFRFP